MKVVTFKKKELIWTDLEVKEIVPIDWSKEYLNTHRYEITITFNPKWFSNIKDMEIHCKTIIEQLIIKCHSALQMNCSMYINYVIEYQSNGHPHIHATLMFDTRLVNSRLTNWEQFFQRLYGKTQIWYTGSVDKIHRNDHFTGPWSKYLLKDNPENYHEYRVEKWNRKAEHIIRDEIAYELEPDDFEIQDILEI